MKVFVADDVNEDKLAPLRDAGIDIVIKTKLDGEALATQMADADGVIVRSATKITAELMDRAPNLRVIGRAGVGVDNIDVRAATQRGIVVMNAPDGNTITTAEHTIALLVSMARNIPQAHTKLQNGEWDKKSFVGVELNGKTLGVVGLGRIGKHVSQIARGFGMQIVAFDPFISPDQAKELGIELDTLNGVFARADFITIHTPVTDETRGIVGKEAFAKMKKGVRIVNCARGGLVDETALLEAIDDGTVAAAALDVFSTEPLPADSPLLGRTNMITTPHLGASTTEAQEGVAGAGLAGLEVEGACRGQEAAAGEGSQVASGGGIEDGQVDGEGAVPLRQISLGERRAGRLAGVVDQDVDRAELAARLRDAVRDLGRIGNVEPGNNQRVAAAELLGPRHQRLAPAPGETDPRTRTRQACRNRSADAGPGPSNEGMASAQRCCV